MSLCAAYRGIGPVQAQVDDAFMTPA
jgi:hypothetical protein